MGEGTKGKLGRRSRRPENSRKTTIGAAEFSEKKDRLKGRGQEKKADLPAGTQKGIQENRGSLRTEDACYAPFKIIKI